MYYFTLNESYWSRQSKILASDGVGDDEFGTSVSIYNNNAFIGARWDDDVAAAAGIYNTMLSGYI